MNEQIDQSNTQTKKRGSWIDILIYAVIAFIIIAIALPNFFRYSARYPGQIGAKRNLAAIYTAYQAYHSDYNTYPSSPSIQIGKKVYNCLSVAGWKPKGRKRYRYSYHCMNTKVFSAKANGFDCPPEIVTSATKDSYTIAACGNADNDATIDVLTIDDAKHLRYVVDDVKL